MEKEGLCAWPAFKLLWSSNNLGPIKQEALSNALPQGSVVEMELRARDVYGRVVARLFLNVVMIFVN